MISHGFAQSIREYRQPGEGGWGGTIKPLCKHVNKEKSNYEFVRGSCEKEIIGKYIDLVSSYKYLGFWIDKKKYFWDLIKFRNTIHFSNQT